MIGENRPDLHQAVLDLRQSLACDESDGAAQPDSRCKFRNMMKRWTISEMYREPEGTYGRDQQRGPYLLIRSSLSLSTNRAARDKLK